MELNGLSSKILNPIEKNASLIGAGSIILERQQGLAESIGNLLGGRVHAPDLRKVLFDAGNNPNYQMAAIAVIASYLIKGTGISMLDRAVRIVGKAGTAYIISGIAENTFYHSTHSPAYSDSTVTNFQNAPLAQRYYP